MMHGQKTIKFLCPVPLATYRASVTFVNWHLYLSTGTTDLKNLRTYAKAVFLQNICTEQKPDRETPTYFLEPERSLTCFTAAFEFSLAYTTLIQYAPCQHMS
jgi:hypothetical protein